MISLQNYKLDLSIQMKIHLIFNICNLKPHHGPVPDIISRESLSCIIEDIEKWKVEAIQDEQQGQYLVKWKGYPETI